VTGKYVVRNSPLSYRRAYLAEKADQLQMLIGFVAKMHAGYKAADPLLAILLCISILASLRS
jgi:hypothetical protein